MNCRDIARLEDLTRMTFCGSEKDSKDCKLTSYLEVNLEVRISALFIEKYIGENPLNEQSLEVCIKNKISEWLPHFFVNKMTGEGLVVLFQNTSKDYAIAFAKNMLNDIPIGHKKAFTWKSFKQFVKPWAGMARILMLKFSQDPFITQDHFDPMCNAWREACKDVYDAQDHPSLNHSPIHLYGLAKMAKFYKSEQINNLFIAALRISHINECELTEFFKIILLSMEEGEYETSNFIYRTFQLIVKNMDYCFGFENPILSSSQDFLYLAGYLFGRNEEIDKDFVKKIFAFIQPKEEDEWTILAHLRIRMVVYSVRKIGEKNDFLYNQTQKEQFDHLMRIADEELQNFKTKNPNLCKIKFNDYDKFTKTNEGIKEKNEAYKIGRTKYLAFQDKIQHETQINDLFRNSDVDNRTDLPNSESSEFASII